MKNHEALLLTEIYCLPGTMCDERLWQFTQSALNSNVRLVPISIPMDDSIDSIVAALENTLPNEAINLMGFSMGGYLASAYTSKFPERVNRLMVLSNSAADLAESELQQRKQALSWIAKQGYKGIPVKKAVSMLGERNKSNENLVGLIQAMDKSLGEAVFVQQLSSSLVRPNLLKSLGKLSLPICFCVGEEDPLVSAESLVNIQLQTKFELHRASRCGHMLPLEQPLWLAQIMTRFFGLK